VLHLRIKQEEQALGVLALAQDHFEEIGETIVQSFQQHGIKAKARQLEIDNDGCLGRVIS